MKPIQIETVELRTLKQADYLDLKSAMISAYEGMGESYWREKSIDTLIEIFPEGQLCVEVNGKVVATALSIIVDYAKLGETHTLMHKQLEIILLALIMMMVMYFMVSKFLYIRIIGAYAWQEDYMIQENYCAKI